MTSHLHLICRPKVWVSIPEQGKHYSVDLNLHVIDEHGVIAARFELMCAAIDGDIESAKGSGAIALKDIQQIEAGDLDLIEADGNAWVAHIAKDKVWFEGLYSQGEGGEVSFAQYKLAVETYVRFLSDPQRRAIKVEFPLIIGDRPRF
jgi:hypothetical protein